MKKLIPLIALFLLLSTSAWAGVTVNVNGTGYTCTAVSPTPTPTPIPTPTGWQGTQLIFQESQAFSLGPNLSRLYYGFVPAECITGSKQLRFNINQQQGAANADMVVKKTYGNPLALPTIADYNRLVGLYGTNIGTTKTNDGIYWAAFSTNSVGETVVIATASAYASQPWYTSAFTQKDTYYLLLVNATSLQTAGFLNIYCY